jgi:hypothetical protein
MTVQYTAEIEILQYKQGTGLWTRQQQLHLQLLTARQQQLSLTLLRLQLD